ncbi:MAG: hypothetical protein IJI24_09505 [Lachnospiraceae bacterium]|nr:hypothetical protein [Lachnospiraceae bacterium]
MMMILILLIFCMLFCTGCRQIDVQAVQMGLKPNPYYQEGDTMWDHGDIEEYYFNQLPSRFNEAYRELYSRLSAGESEADLYAKINTEDFFTAYYSVLYDHPELFWLDGHVEVMENSFTGNVVSFTAGTSITPEERESKTRALEAAADACIGQIGADWSDYEKIKFVYEYLINTVDYDRSAPDSQNIQSALLSGKSVCAGYAKSFQYILHRMGLFCTYVTGSVKQKGDHAWNIVRIGERYYNVDVTWGDPVFLGEVQSQKRSLMNYNYLCATDAELEKTHESRAQVPMPVCDDDSYNYYRRNGMYYESFDYDTIYGVLMNSVWNGQESVTMKFARAEDYNTAVYELFSNHMLEDPAAYLMEINGRTTWNYSYNHDPEFNLITIYWY